MAQQSCSYCGGPFNGGNCLSSGIVGVKNEFVHDPNPFPYNNTPDFYDQPPQHHVETYSCELCGNDSLYGYDCPPRFPLDPEDSLIMGNEELNTIPKKESDEVIKSSVEDFVPIPSESEDTSRSDSEWDLPSLMTSHPSNEDVPKENVKIYSNPLFEFDDEYISSGGKPIFNEVSEDIKSKYSYDSNLNELALLVTLLFYSNEDECFDPGDDVDEINAFDIPLDFEDGYFDSKGDVLYLESFLSDDTTPNLPLKVFLDRDLRSLSDINDLKVMVKVFDLIIPKNFFSNICELTL
nr:hypothetical protein [Tanacetum cinerariifolium]